MLRRGATPDYHRVRRPQPYRAGLASFATPGLTLGLDTEGTRHTPECVTVAQSEKCVALVEVVGHSVTPFLGEDIARARALVIHHSKHDIAVLATLGIEELPRVDDTMLEAYLLGLPQGLKVLAWRLLGYEMSDYSDLVDPMDAVRVQETLSAAIEHWQHRHKGMLAVATAVLKRDGARRGLRVTKKAIKELYDIGVKRTKTCPPMKVVKAAARMASKADATAPLRARWSKSVNAPWVTLPPVPTWKDVPQHVREPYAMVDAVAHLDVHNALWPRIQNEGLRRVYEIDRRVLPWLIRNERVGLACDGDALRALSVKFQRDFDIICTKINDLADADVNPLSGDQVSDCLFEQLGIQPTRLTKGGKHYTTADKYLKARKHQHEIIPLILEARQINKYKGTYTDKLPGMLRDGRYYPNWKYTRTATGRLAEEVILLIPKHSARAKEIRNAFHATDGHTLVSVDLSQIELRVMTDLSQDRRLLDAYRAGEDIHAAVAHALLGAPRKKSDQDESLHRLPAKTLNFGIINGMSEYGLLDQLHEAGQLHWNIDTVREMLQGWFVVHSGVDAYFKARQHEARSTGAVRGMFGRRRMLSGIWSTDDRIRRSAERECLFPIQNGADDISKIWNAAIWEKIILPRQRAGQYCEPWVRVHDDTTLEVDEARADDVKAEMLALVPDLLSIPTLAEGKTGVSWGDLH